MKIDYLCDGEKKNCQDTCPDLEVHVLRESCRVSVTITAERNLTLEDASDSFHHEISCTDLVFLNGYQSWTDTREYAVNERQRNVERIPKLIRDKFAFRQYGDQSFYQWKRNCLHGVDLAYIRGDHPLFLGNYNYRYAYLILEFYISENRVELHSDVQGRQLSRGESFTIFDYTINDKGLAGMEEYFARMTSRSNRKLFGYTSWYNHYQNISEDKILSALDGADSRFDLFQIDDGFESFVGDWLSADRKKFPNGLTPIVEKIHQKGMLAGIWLAPFAAESKSQIVAEHPDWIAQKNGKMIPAGSNWSGFFTLDLNNQQAIDYIKAVLKQYVEQGFDFFKLDFLYVCNLQPLIGRTRAETAEFAYQLLRDTLGDCLILGCGAVLSSGYGKFDYMRIGPDVSLEFDDVFYMRKMHRERISTKVTLQNTIFRFPLNGHAFQNDPDVFLLRDDYIKLSYEQRCALTTLNALFGSLLMTSDNLCLYDNEKQMMLEKALELFYKGAVTDYCRNGRFVEIQYVVDGNTPQRLVYDTVKGVLV